MFRDIISIKSDIKLLFHNNKFLWLINYIKFKIKFYKILKKLDNIIIDVEILKEFYDFLRITSIQETDLFKKKYKISLYSDKNTIKFMITSTIGIVITIYQDHRINIIYNDNLDTIIYEMIDNLNNFDNRDLDKVDIIFYINKEIIKVIQYSLEVFIRS